MLHNRDALESWDRAHFFHPTSDLGLNTRGSARAGTIESGAGVCAVGQAAAAAERP